MPQNTYFTYILASRRNGTLYTGVTSDLERRVAEHRAGLGGAFTRRYKVHRLVWFEEHGNVEQAILRERRIKKWRRAWKLEMIEKGNPGWRDLVGGERAGCGSGSPLSRG